jgi:phosphonate transport system substrate-binding protein
MRSLFNVAQLFAISIICLMGGVSHAAGTLILGVQDYGKSPRMLTLEFRGLAEYLSKKLGQTIVVEATQSYERYLQQARSKRYAFMFGPPSMVMEANAAAGYMPVAKIPGLLSASFMSMADGPIAFPEDMKGMRVGMPDEHSLMTMLALSTLREMKIDPKRYFSSVQTFNDAEDVISALKLGLIDVGVANSSLYNAWGARGYNLNMVLQSGSSPHLTFAIRDDLPPKTTAMLSEALLTAHKDGIGKTYFAQSGFPQFEAATLREYEGIKKLLARK